MFLKTNICWLCDKEHKTMNDNVRHYCKLSGNYLGAAHQSCIDYVNKSDQHKFLPILYHNFSRYDNHMLFDDLTNSKNDIIKL